MSLMADYFQAEAEKLADLIEQEWFGISND
jgi:hypothetical protein